VKNILVFEDSSKAKFGGGQKVTLDVVESLFKNYNLYLIDCDKDSIFKNKISKYLKNKFEIKCYGKVVGGHNSSFGLGLLEVIYFPLLFIMNLRKIIKIIKNEKELNSKNTIIYSTTKKTLIFAYFINKITGIEYIFHAHSFDNKKSLFYKLIEIPLKNAYQIMCVSNLIKNNIGLNNCKTVYNSINVNTQINNKNILEKHKVIVASFSTLIKWKGIEFFMKSYEHLNNKHCVEFWVFGEGYEKDNLRQYENQNVILKGFADDSEFIMENEIDIIVVPSISEEACPMVPLEAFKCGVPVISTDIGGQAEIVKDGEVGYYVPIKDSKAIAEKIDYLIDNQDVYNKLSEQCIKYSQKFSKEEYKLTINKIFGKII